MYDKRGNLVPRVEQMGGREKTPERNLDALEALGQKQDACHEEDKSVLNPDLLKHNTALSSGLM